MAPVGVLEVVPAAVLMVAGRWEPVAVILKGVPVEVAVVPVLDETAVLLVAVGLAGVADVLIGAGARQERGTLEAVRASRAMSHWCRSSTESGTLEGGWARGALPPQRRACSPGRTSLLIADWPVGVAEE